VVELRRRRPLERGDLEERRVHGLEDVLDRTVLAGRVGALQDDEHGSGALGEQTLLQLADPFAQLGDAGAARGLVEAELDAGDVGGRSISQPGGLTGDDAERVQHEGEGTFAGMADVTVWFNPRCSKCRTTQGLLAERGVDADYVRYLDTAPTKEELQRVLAMLGTDDPRAIARPAEAPWSVLELDTATWRARSPIERAFAPESPAPRSCSSSRSTTASAVNRPGTRARTRAQIAAAAAPASCW
jgi:arsenate reductase-like glutaredoxin family protein